MQNTLAINLNPEIKTTGRGLIHMKTIESVSDMIAWAEEVNTLVTTNTKRVCELQDVWGRSTCLTLNKIYCEELKGTRSLVAFAIHKIMAYDTFESMIKTWIAFKLNKERESMRANIDKEFQRVENAQQRLQESKKAVFKRIRTERSRSTRIEKLSRLKSDRLTSISALLAASEDKVSRHVEDAKKYRLIVGLINPDVDRTIVTRQS